MNHVGKLVLQLQSARGHNDNLVTIFSDISHHLLFHFAILEQKNIIIHLIFHSRLKVCLVLKVFKIIIGSQILGISSSLPLTTLAGFSRMGFYWDVNAMFFILVYYWILIFYSIVIYALMLFHWFIKVIRFDFSYDFFVVNNPTDDVI